MAMAAPQEPAQAGMPSIANSFSHAAAAAAASMVSIFPHQMFYHHSTCKGAAATPPLSQLRTMDSSVSQFESDNVYGLLDESSPLPLYYTPVQSVGAGLANLGNTCFLNSVLQCLTYTPPLAAHLQAGLHNISCQAKGFCAMCALERHVREALSSSGRIVSPSYLAKNLRCISRSFQMWRQEDAHEYMRYFIEALQRCCSVEFLGGRSLIDNVFGGRLRSQVKCTHCSHCSNKYDPFLDLSLEVARADSLHKALAHFTAIEVLDGDNKYHCSKCNTKVRAQKQFTIDKAPPILTVQFKRFSSCGSYGGKIDKKIHFERDLDLKPFVNGVEDEELNYSLYAVLVHSGWSTHSGHYYCFVRTGKDTWHAMDDSQVYEVSESTVLGQKAYILFYVRNVRSSVSPTSRRLEKNIDDQVTSPLSWTSDHLQESSDDSGTDDRSTNSDYSNHFEASDEDGALTRDEQVLAHLKGHDASGVSFLGESQEKQHTQAVLETDEHDRFTTAKEQENFSLVKDMDAAVINDSCEISWYRAVQVINSSRLRNNGSVGTEARELVCLSHVDDGHEKNHLCEQSEYTTGDDACGGGMTACSATASNDDASSGLEGDEVSIPDSDCLHKWRSIFHVTSPILRASRIETAGQHAFSILCMCAKFCFWSCFWPPL